MIRHQSISMYVNVGIARFSSERVEAVHIIFISEKACTAIIAAVNDVPGNPGNTQASVPRHCHSPCEQMQS
jgi:hypothetical protein